MDDLISRQGAIDTIGKTQTYKLFEGDDMILIDRAEVQIDLMLLPSAERKGKWINNSPVTMKCDQCGYVIKDWRWNELNFCANCGADMRERKEERV